MARCTGCSREIQDHAAFCPYCGAQNQSGTQAKDVPPESNKPGTPDKVKSGQSEKPKLTNKMKIVIIIAAAVVLVTAVVTVGFILKSRKTTFDFTTVQYTEQINKAAGEELLDKETWKINGAYAVYEGDGFSVTLETDADSELIKKISITPSDHPVAKRIIIYTAEMTDTNYSDDDDNDEGDNDSRTVEFTLDGIKETTTIPVTRQTEPPKTTYTAMDLIDMDLSEIVGIMGNDYQLNKQRFSTAFGSDPVLMIYHETTLPGLAVCPSYSSGIYQHIKDGLDVREKIQQGDYAYDGIAVYGSGKLNDKISADMTYSEVAAEIGDFDTQGVAQGTLVYSTQIDGKRVSFFFAAYENKSLEQRVQNNKVTAADMKEVDPKLASIAVFKAKNTSSGTGASANADWKKLYTEYIIKEYSKNQNSAFFNPEYALILLDDDDVPELTWCNYKSYGRNDQLVWIDSGQICHEDYSKVSFYDERKGLFWGNWPCALHSSQRHLATLKDGAFQWLYIEVSGASDSTGRNPYSNIENNTIDKAEYEEMAEKVKSTGKEPTYVSKDEILKQIEQY